MDSSDIPKSRKWNKGHFPYRLIFENYFKDFRLKQTYMQMGTQSVEYFFLIFIASSQRGVRVGQSSASVFSCASCCHILVVHQQFSLNSREWLVCIPPDLYATKLTPATTYCEFVLVLLSVRNTNSKVLLSYLCKIIFNARTKQKHSF